MRTRPSHCLILSLSKDEARATASVSPLQTRDNSALERIFRRELPAHRAKTRGGRKLCSRVIDEMRVGDPNQFAIESGITEAYERSSFLALGFFRLFIGGSSYGVVSPDATLLACSFDEVCRRLADRGNHGAPFSAHPCAIQIAEAVANACWGRSDDAVALSGFLPGALNAFVYTNHLVWAPDGDEAFDDGSVVLQFDIANRVRLIGFIRSLDERGRCAARSGSVREAWIEADDFYALLRKWRRGFLRAWNAAPKVSMATDDRHRK